MTSQFARWILGLAAACTGTAYAGDTQINGFLRAAAGITNSDVPVQENRIDRRGDTRETQLGINISRELSEKWSVAGQLWTIGAAEASYHMMLDWAFLTYRATNMLKLSAGKIKYPNLLVSEFYDVGIAYPWVRPPQEVYSFDTGGRPNLSIESFGGGMATFESSIGKLDYSMQIYSGNAELDLGRLRKMAGLKFKVGNEAISMVAGYNMHTPADTIAEGGAPALKNNHTVTTLSFGANVDWKDILVLSEYVQGGVDKQTDLDATGMYATLGYRVGAFTPHLTYGKLDADEGRESMSYGLKFQLTHFATLKLEYQQVTPTAKIGTPPQPFNITSGAIDVVF